MQNDLFHAHCMARPPCATGSARASHDTGRSRLPARNRVIGLLIMVALAAGGCVQRRLTIRSNPPGARVYVGDEEIGTTPVSTDFVYYGTRRIRLAKDGYETL